MNVRDGGINSVWYYGQTIDGRFYKETVTDFDSIYRKIYYLD
jgi:hypothetical protein